MKKNFIASALLPLLGAAAFYNISSAEKLVILHTNDTHSTIDPLDDGTGGVLQRKVIIDSVRNAEKNVLLVDAGDVVQGTLYFKYFNGDVEYPLMDMLGYDLRVLGNHEFDNGMASLAKYYKETKAIPLSSNYDFSGTPLEGIFLPYTVKEYGGKRIGFIGINLDPASIISQKNFEGRFLEVIPVANEMANRLKQEERCDMVVAISHIGYDKVNDKTSDIELAQSSRDIDLIIGGHTHTYVNPEDSVNYPSLFKNKEGKNVRVVQTGKQGRNIGKLTIDLDQLPLTDGKQIDYEWISVSDRFPQEKYDRAIIEFLQPFSHAVDSVNNLVIACSEYDLPKERTGGLANLTADMGLAIGREIADSLRETGINISAVDLALMNVGGIRHHMPKGVITEGQILSTYPFSNRFVLIGVKGADFIEAMRVSASKGGEAVSGNIRVVSDSVGNLRRVIIDGKEMDPEKEYIVATIDYVAEGNDDLVSLANHRKIWEGDEEVAQPFLRWIRRQNELGLKIAPDQGMRFVVDVNEE